MRRVAQHRLRPPHRFGHEGGSGPNGLGVAARLELAALRSTSHEGSVHTTFTVMFRDYSDRHYH
jgi:hypothetical protein